MSSDGISKQIVFGGDRAEIPGYRAPDSVSDQSVRVPGRAGPRPYRRNVK